MHEIILDSEKIASIRHQHGISAPSLNNISDKLLLIHEELSEAYRHVTFGHSLTAITLSADIGWWCKAHHKTSCAASECELRPSDMPTGQEDPSNWERYELSKPEGFGIEIADAIMRLVDIAYANAIDLQTCLDLKIDYNAQRPYQHGRSYAP